MTALPTTFSEVVFPRTRYQGSKRRTAESIVAEVSNLSYTTVLDAFGGTGAVAYAFKRAGKHVTYNDVLNFNHQIGVALIENDKICLGDDDAAWIGRRRPNDDYPDFIEKTFDEIYFTREENRWLDTAITNIRAITCRFKQALSWFALFQSSMAKRPYNLFHRRNLYLRTADVPRSFGNKASWDRPFEKHFKFFAAQANRAVIDGGGTCRAICRDAIEIEPEYDLVYIDTPYINRNRVGVDYQAFYHFLEGMCRYDDWAGMIDPTSKHRGLRRITQPWSDPNRFCGAFEVLCARFRNSILVVSYRSDGIPSIDAIRCILGIHKQAVRVLEWPRRPYALSSDKQTREVLLIAT